MNFPPKQSASAGIAETSNFDREAISGLYNSRLYFVFVWYRRVGIHVFVVGTTLVCHLGIAHTEPESQTSSADDYTMIDLYIQYASQKSERKYGKR